MLSSVQKRRNSNVVRLVLGIVACLILMDHSFADTASSTSTDSTTAIAVSNEESKEQVLKFLLLGDWGKGGNSGYSTTRIPDMPEVTNDDESPIVFPKTYNTMESAFDNRLTDVHVMGNRSRGLQDATYQAAVAAGMASYSKNFEPSFVVALGDNFYVNGVSSSTDVYWDYLWTNVYLDNYPQLRIPWYPVFGKSYIRIWSCRQILSIIKLIND